MPKFPLDFIFEKDVAIYGHSDIEKAKKFIEKIQIIHQQVQEQLEKSHKKYKERHDKHRVDHKFQEGDEVWFHISKGRMQREGKNLKPIHYGPFKIIKKVGNNAFQLDLPSYMQKYSVVNVEKLCLYEPPLIDDQGSDVRLPSIEYLSPEFLDEIEEDTILDTRKRAYKMGSVDYLRVGIKGSKPSNEKWMEVEKVRELYPHLLNR